MNVKKRLTDVINQELFNEISETLERLQELSIFPGFPVFSGQGLAILGSELYTPPFVSCISISLPLTVDEAAQMHDGWMKIQKSALQLPYNKPADLKRELIKTVIEESYKNNINSYLILKLSAFWVSQLKEVGISFQEQVNRNKDGVVTGNFSLMTVNNKCSFFSEEIGRRIMCGGESIWMP